MSSSWHAEPPPGAPKRGPPTDRSAPEQPNHKKGKPSDPFPSDPQPVHPRGSSKPASKGKRSAEGEKNDVTDIVKKTEKEDEGDQEYKEDESKEAEPEPEANEGPTDPFPEDPEPVHPDEHLTPPPSSQKHRPSPKKSPRKAEGAWNGESRLKLFEAFDEATKAAVKWEEVATKMGPGYTAKQCREQWGRATGKKIRKALLED
ncbi:hypothetical protein P7C73_g5398, partial [Tremellales sp. Uapishka_1]